jgi:uncharacterized protein
VLISRRGILLGSASVALAGCGGGGGGGAQPQPGPPAAGPAPPPGAGLPTGGPGASDTYMNQVVGYGPLIPDPAGLFDLPQGFSYRILSRFGETMDDGFLVPSAADGMGSFDLGGGRVALVRNHELSVNGQAGGPTQGRADLEAKIDRARAYGSQSGLVHPGGTTTLVYDLNAQRLVSQHLSLIGTLRNCAGGTTPWGSWLSCEETLHVGDRSHGWVFEVPADARGLVEPVPLTGLGRFVHEAAAVDPTTGAVYLTEDHGEGLFYRFLPNSRGRLREGGRLQALAFVDGTRDTRNWSGTTLPVGQWRSVRWIDMEGVDNPAGDLSQRGNAKGAAVFARGEGIFPGDGELYFACTSGGPAKIGQIFRYQPSRREGQADEAGEPGRIQLFSEPPDAKLFSFADNIAVAPWSHLIVCEDKGVSEPVNHLKGITPQGEIYTIARNAHAERGELAGVCFSPDGSTMFLNIYKPTTTLAVTGPWRNFNAAPYRA